ncbi:MAG TPA: VanZ family protein [Thermoanaerobaculia bacterium]|nr:VanZ family protein [Thermoanaerobaculia bacterium]
MKRFFNYWLPVVIWSAMILSAANDSLSAQNSGHWLRTILPFLDDAQLAFVNFLIRKLTHILIYAILGTLAFRAVRSEREGWRRSWWLAAIAIACAVAIADESLQGTTALRGGNVWDVLLDTVAAAIASFGVRRPCRRFGSRGLVAR